MRSCVRVSSTAAVMFRHCGLRLVSSWPRCGGSRYPAASCDRERQEFDVTDVNDANEWNAKTIAEFRANEGRVGGPFQGAPMVLMHARGRQSGREYVSPMMYIPHDTDENIIYVFATKGGAPT